MKRNQGPGFPAFLNEYKDKISLFLRNFLSECGSENSRINHFGSEVADDLSEFTMRGKMIRGALVFIGSRLSGSGPAESDIVKTAAAIELFQSGLLVHDDIMDQDLVRRGKPSMHALYGSRYGSSNQDNHIHLGESLGICAGDIAFFLACELLTRLDCPSATRISLLSLFSREMSVVATAQMQDIMHGEDPSFPDPDRILSLYRYKTGRYSFSLPLSAGATLAGAELSERQALEEIGEIMGILFQIRDDELGLAGNESRLGKPVGSDIEEGKKTLPLCLLYNDLPTGEKEHMRAVLGGKKKNPADISYISGLYRERNTSVRVAEIQKKYVAELENRLTLLPSGQTGAREQLEELSGFILGRDY
ncbi:MAG: polyprenyl synthetase family protein [Spirochaetales bacterium]|nr:polyprenyl synthetase family protein [Spirochaetales bacterium]